MAATPFADVYEAYAPAVYRYCLSQLGEPVAAEDAAAETFANAYVAWPGLAEDDPVGVRRWIFRIARDAVVDRDRQRRRRHRVDVETVAAPREELRAALDALAARGQRERELVGLRVAAGLSDAEIAVLLRIKEQAVRTATQSDPEERDLAELFATVSPPESLRYWDHRVGVSPQRQRVGLGRRVLRAVGAGLVGAPGERRLRPLAAALVLPVAVLAAAGGMEFKAHFLAGPSGQPGSPKARSDAAMTFDAARGVVVMFGGSSADGLLGDTWTWDGSIWRQQRPRVSPPPRANAALGFDAAHGVVVMFGGNTGAAPYSPGPNDATTWTWDGDNWRQVTTRHTPTAVQQRMAFDEQRNQLLLVTEEESGTATPVANVVPGAVGLAPPMPPVRSLPRPIPVPGHGGLYRPPPVNLSTWTWSGADWVPHLGVAPADVLGPLSLAWDAASKRVVLLTSETRQVCPTIQEPPPPPSPPPGVPHGDVFRVLPSCTVDTTSHAWAWDGKQWHEMKAPATQALARAVLVSDPSTGHLDAQLPEAMWTGDGSTWTQRGLPPQLRRRTAFALATDTNRRTVVLFGGHAGEPFAGDTWTWDGSTWTHRAGPTVAAPTPYPTFVATPPPVCTLQPQARVSATPAGADALAITIRLDPVGAACAPLAGPLLLVDDADRPLPVTGNPFDTPTGATFVTFTWHNWCGTRQVSLEFPSSPGRMRQPLATLPPCVNRYKPSTVGEMTVSVVLP